MSIPYCSNCFERMSNCKCDGDYPQIFGENRVDLIRARKDERQAVIKEIESLLVDDVLREKSDMLEAVYHRQKGRNELRRELRAKLVEMKGKAI